MAYLQMLSVRDVSLRELRQGSAHLRQNRALSHSEGTLRRAPRIRRRASGRLEQREGKTEFYFPERSGDHGDCADRNAVSELARDPTGPGEVQKTPDARQRRYQL